LEQEKEALDSPCILSSRVTTKRTMTTKEEVAKGRKALRKRRKDTKITEFLFA
jgi:hypothetical protein